MSKDSHDRYEQVRSACDYDWNDPELVAVYDELPLWSAAFGAVLLRYIPLRPGLRVLDVGCGTGFPLLELAGRLGPSCFTCGIDPWRAALVRARRKMATWDIRDVALVDGDATAMPFNDCVFDLIVSNLGINNFADPQAALAECARVARRGASIALATNLQGHMQEFYDVFAEVLRPFDHPLLLKELQAHIAHRTTVEAICAMLARAGLRVAQVHREAFTMRFLDGTALLGHAFIRVAFLDGWRSVVPPELAGQVFARLEERLNCLAAARGELALTIPLAYVAAVKQG